METNQETTPVHPQLTRPILEELEEALLAVRMELVRDHSGVEATLNEIEKEREIEWEEVAQEEQSADVLTRLTAQQFAQLRQIDGALERVDRGEYGICMACREPIAIERLRAQPWAPYCGDCTDAEERAAAADGALADDRRATMQVRPQVRPQDVPQDLPDESADPALAGTPLTPELDALDDAEVAATIREAFQTEVGDALETVRVLCRDRKVILAGDVANETLPEIARRIVEDEIGYEVIDRMMITEFAGQSGRNDARAAAAQPAPPAINPVDEDDESDLSEDVLEVEEEGLTFVPPSRPVPER
jgi:DnaK suppressor protein